MIDFNNIHNQIVNDLYNAFNKYNKTPNYINANILSECIRAYNISAKRLGLATISKAIQTNFINYEKIVVIYIQSK